MYRDSTKSTEALEKLWEPIKKIGDFRKLLGFLVYFKQTICDFSIKAIRYFECTPEKTPSNLWHPSKKSVGQHLSNEKREHSITVESFTQKLKYPNTENHRTPQFLVTVRSTMWCKWKRAGDCIASKTKWKMKVIS